MLNICLQAGWQREENPAGSFYCFLSLLSTRDEETPRAERPELGSRRVLRDKEASGLPTCIILFEVFSFVSAVLERCAVVKFAGKGPQYLEQVGSADLLISAFSCELPGASDLQAQTMQGPQGLGSRACRAAGVWAMAPTW